MTGGDERRNVLEPVRVETPHERREHLAEGRNDDDEHRLCSNVRLEAREDASQDRERDAREHDLPGHADEVVDREHDRNQRRDGEGDEDSAHVNHSPRNGDRFGLVS